MNCRLSSEYMMKSIDGNINDIENAQMRQHMKSCKVCSKEFKELNEIFAFLETESTVEPPQNFEIEVMKKIDMIEADRKRKSGRGLVFLYNLTAVVLIMLLVVFAAGLKEINVLNVIEQVGGHFTSVSNVLMALYNAAEGIYSVVSGMVVVLFEVAVTIFKAYYYIFITLLALLIAVQKMFLILVNQDGGDKG